MNFTREFIQGTTVFMIRPRADEAEEVADFVRQFIPTLLPGEEIRIVPKPKPISQPGGEAAFGEKDLLPWEEPWVQ